MSILDPRAWLAAILGLALAYCGGRWEQSAHDKAVYQAKATAAALDAARAQIKAVDTARIEERRRTDAQTEIANAAKNEADMARDDARTAGDAADRLRARVAELLAVGRAAGNPTSPAGSAAAGDPLGVLADVLEKADRRAGILAEYADAAHIAGQTCERSYDALSQP
jgi:hypothetical protein